MWQIRHASRSHPKMNTCHTKSWASALATLTHGARGNIVQSLNVDADGYHGGLRHSAASSPTTSANGANTQYAGRATKMKSTIQGRSAELGNPWTESYNHSPPVDP